MLAKLMEETAKSTRVSAFGIDVHLQLTSIADQFEQGKSRESSTEEYFGCVLTEI